MPTLARPMILQGIAGNSMICSTNNPTCRISTKSAYDGFMTLTTSFCNECERSIEETCKIQQQMQQQMQQQIQQQMQQMQQQMQQQTEQSIEDK
jgi:predicted Fe-S protein YdhL (DUF1289 family)